MKTYTLAFILCTISVFSQSKIDSLLDAGLSNDQFENPQKAIENTKYILNRTDATNQQKIRAYHLMNAAYGVMGEYEKAISASVNAKELADKEGSTEYSVLALGSIAENYRKLNLYDEALYKYKEALQLLNDNKVDKKKTKFMPAAIQYEIGNIWYLKKKYEQALKNYRESIKLTKLIEPEKEEEHKSKMSFLASKYLLMGHCYVALKKPDSAEIYYSKVQKIVVSEDNKFMNVYLLKSYGDLYYEKGEYQRAIDSTQKAEASLFFDDPELKTSMYELLAKSHAKTGNSKKSEKYYDLLTTEKRSFDEEKNKATSLAFSSFKNEMHGLVYEQKIWKYVLATILLLLSIMSIYFFYNHKKKTEENRKRYEKIIAQLEAEKSQQKIQTKNIRNTLSISDDKETELLKKLSKFEQSEKFIQKNITLSYMANYLNTNTTYLSELINQHKEKNFNAYINELKIKYIIHKIQSDPSYLNYKVTYLAEKCGLPYSTFVAVFKEFTGMTPSEFIKQKLIHEKHLKQ